jgi:hypothetical protein
VSYAPERGGHSPTNVHVRGQCTCRGYPYGSWVYKFHKFVKLIDSTPAGICTCRDYPYGSWVYKFHKLVKLIDSTPAGIEIKKSWVYTFRIAVILKDSKASLALLSGRTGGSYARSSSHTTPAAVKTRSHGFPTSAPKTTFPLKYFLSSSPSKALAGGVGVCDF